MGIRGLVQSVLTGNIRLNALLKLKTFGLDQYIDFRVGAYGPDDAHRPNLVRLARQRARDRLDLNFNESTTVLIGGSSRDVGAAQEGGARIVAVATGCTDAHALHAAGVDIVLPDLRDTTAVLRAVVDTGSHKSRLLHPRGAPDVSGRLPSPGRRTVAARGAWSCPDQRGGTGSVRRWHGAGQASMSVGGPLLVRHSCFVRRWSEVRSALVYPDRLV